MRRRIHRGGDPYWMVARYGGECARCGAAFKAGARVFIYTVGGKRILAGGCADDGARDFAAHRQDERVY